MRPKRRVLETLRLLVPERAAATYRAALEPHVLSIAWFEAGSGRCLVEVVRDAGSDEAALRIGLALAETASGVAATISRAPTEVSGWLERTWATFPEQHVGKRLVIRGGHLGAKRMPGRIVLGLDAAMAFGSGEHASTRGCLLALERLAWCRPGKLLDLGTGSGILALAAAGIWRRPVLAVDCDADAVRTARRNVRANRLGAVVRVVPGRGWLVPQIRRAGQFDLVVANILARPLAMMARGLSRRLAPGGYAVLSGLLTRQVPLILAAHRRSGIVLAGRITVDGWTTLILRAPYDRGIIRCFDPYSA